MVKEKKCYIVKEKVLYGERKKVLYGERKKVEKYIIFDIITYRLFRKE